MRGSKNETDRKKRGTFPQFETLFSWLRLSAVLVLLYFIVAQLNFIVRKKHLNRNENTRISSDTEPSTMC